MMTPLSLASEELGTTSKVATVNAALRRVAKPAGPAARMLELLDETGTDLSDEGAARGMGGDGRTRLSVLLADKSRAGMGQARHPRPGPRS